MRRLAMRGVRAVLRRRLDRGRPAGGWTRRARRLLHALLHRHGGGGLLGRTAAHWGALGRFDAAITTYERSLQAWPDRLRRDQGLCLAACQRLCGPRRRGASMPGWSSGGRRHSGGNIQPGAERGAACPGAPGAVAPACGSIGARRPDPRLAVPGRVARGGRSVD